LFINHKYLIHLPHSGIEIPKEYIDDYYISQQELKENIFEYADLYTDELFSSLFDTFDGVKNKYSRLFFDPERFGDDNQEEMYIKFKLGWFYENAILKKKPLRDSINKNKIRKYFDEHHWLLNEKTKQKLDMFDECTIIDCHSFSNKRYWFHEDILLPDICIGFEKNHVDEKLVEIIKNEFKKYNLVKDTMPYIGIYIFQYKNPNNQRGILFPNPTSFYFRILYPLQSHQQLRKNSHTCFLIIISHHIDNFTKFFRN